jgi:glucokinase
MAQRVGAVALDVGGSKIACGFFLSGGELLFYEVVATSHDSAESSIAQIVSLTERALAEVPRDVVAAGLGIVVPGWVNRKARTVWAPNVAGWDHLPLEARLAEQLPVPIYLDSDRSGYVKGEAWLGAARGLDDVVFLAVGTGIGAGIIAGGRLVHGHDDLAGAVGWLALNPRYSDLYARMGCFEAEASGNSVGRKAAERLSPPHATSPDGIPSSRDVVRAAVAGDMPAIELLNEVTQYLGMGIANMVSTLNPQMVVLGGGLFQSGAYLLERICREFTRWAQPFAAERVRIELSALGDRAGLCGAARIALDNILETPGKTSGA